MLLRAKTGVAENKSKKNKKKKEYPPPLKRKKRIKLIFHPPQHGVDNEDKSTFFQVPVVQRIDSLGNMHWRTPLVLVENPMNSNLGLCHDGDRI